MKTPDSLKTENWYYMQVFTNLPSKSDSRTHQHVYTICFAQNKERCTVMVERWLSQVIGADPAQCSINYYLKNYKLKAKEMVRTGAYLSEDHLTPTPWNNC